MSTGAQLLVLSAALAGAAGVYFESTTMVVVATVAATAGVIKWVRWTAPHDHWQSMRRNRSSR
jgi:hypothetical protein